MADREITVPRLDWLIGGSRIGLDYNRFTGSCGTNPLKGCLKEKIFNYSIFIEKNGDEETIKAVTFPGLKCMAECDAELISEKVFSCDEEGLCEIREWIESKRDEYYAQ